MIINLYYWYKFFKDLVLIYPVYILLFETRGLTVSQISMLLAVWSASVVVLEIPTGIIADHWNRKKMLLIGSFTKAGCFACWYFADSFSLFALGFILWGISESFCSGSEEALLYDTLKEQGLEGRFDKVYGTGNFFANLGVALSVVSGGFLAQALGMKPVLLSSVISMLITGLLAAAFKEANCFTEGQNINPGEQLAQSLTTLKDAVKLCLRNRVLLIVILMSILAVGMAGILDEFDPLIADRYGLSLGLVGIWVGVRSLLEALGSKIAYQIRSLLNLLGIPKGFYEITILSLAAGFCLAIAGWFKSIWLMPVYGLFYLFLASAGILQEDYVQQQITGEGRSTVHSLISLAYNLYGILFFGLFSLLLAGHNLHQVMVIIAGYLTIVCLVFSLINFKVSKKSR